MSFKHWVHLQKSLKYEKLRLSHGISYPDEHEKRELLESLRHLHASYYETQLSIRALLSRSSLRKTFDHQPRTTLGDTYTYVERFVLALRQSRPAFNIIVQSITPTTPHLDLLVESFAFSFFEDLMNPENSELELLKVIHELAIREYERKTHITTIFEEGSSSVLGKMLMFYTKRRSQMKYLKLLFKKPLAKLAFYSDIWNFDLKDIHDSLSKSLRGTNVGIEPHSKKKKRTFLGSLFHHERSASPQAEPSESEPIDYLQDMKVRSRINHISSEIARFCEFILEAIYENVKAMPTGVRWVCRTLSELCKGKETEDTRNVMLGTFLFSKWWIPAIMKAEENGLLPDANYSFRKNFPIIGNVLKKVFRGEMFDSPQYAGLNGFIQAQIPRIQRYFQELVQVDDLFHKSEPPQPKAVPQFQSSPFDSSHVMAHYYHSAVLDCKPRVVQLPLIHSVQEMATFQEFRFQAVMLSIAEVRALADLVLAQEPAFRKSYLMNIVNFARKIKEADSTEPMNVPESEEIRYLMFLEEKLPDGMESSYVAKLHRSHTLLPKTEDFKQRRVLSKVKEALRNLLFALDSFAMFFESKDDSSLGQIVDFVLKFSYLFESRKSSIQDKVPLKILAQYLYTHLEQIPEEYRNNNYRKLYIELMSEYELRFEQKHQVASRNKQLLLTCNPLNSDKYHGKAYFRY